MCVYVCLCMCIVLVMGWVRETVVRVVLVYQSIRICTHTNGQIGRLDNKNHTFNHLMVFLKRSDILSLVKRLYSISHNACPLCLPPPLSSTYRPFLVCILNVVITFYRHTLRACISTTAYTYTCTYATMSSAISTTN